MRSAFGHALFKSFAGFAAAVLTVTAAPALANTSASAAAEVTEPVKEEQEETLATGDPSFRKLFLKWTALDDSGPEAYTKSYIPRPKAIVERPVVAVPSLRPINGGRVSSRFGMRIHPIHRVRKHHAGIDLAAPTGTPVYATADGVITRANRARGYGLVIYMDHGSKLETRYAHLSRILVADGQRVKKGDIIGRVGSTGWSTGPHLHYEVRVNGVAVNPVPYMKENSATIAAAQQRATLTTVRKRPGKTAAR